MVVISKLAFAISSVFRGGTLKKFAILISITLALAINISHAQTTESVLLDEQGYKVKGEGESEFDNQSNSFVKDWRDAVPADEYEDTDFGEFIYNEASIPTRLEVLRLLSKDTPSLMVFMTAISMGLDIENTLQASVKYEPEKGRDFAASAVNLLPILTVAERYLYSGYELEDLERENEEDPYSVEEVIEKFFDQRLVLRPYPDWHEGQAHFMASAAELKRLQAPQKDVRWYRAKTTEDNDTRRPVFVSLYEASSSILIDSEERIEQALMADPNARLPVVFIFNRLNERAVDELEYPPTIKGLQRAYTEKQLMLTPTPEWQLGEYHIYSSIDEFYEIFTIPEEEDFEPEHWQRLLEEAEDYAVTNTAFLLVVVGHPEDDEEKDEADTEEQKTETTKLAITHNQLYAAWDDPRTESEYPFATSTNTPPVTLKNMVGQGLIFNRPDLIAALKALGVKRAPVVFYYNDSSRVKPYTKGPRALIQAAIGVSFPNGVFGRGGGIICASPPCTEEAQ